MPTERYRDWKLDDLLILVVAAALIIALGLRVLGNE